MGGEGADLHRVLCRPTQPGWAAWAGDGSPACRRWCYARLGPASPPWHSELRQPAPRALSRVALLVGGRAACSPRLAEPQPRRIDATRGQRRCPKVSGGRRGAAGWPPSRRTRPFSLVGWATGSPVRRRGGQRVPPRCCSSILRARWAAGTAHMPPRPGTTGTQRQHATWSTALLGTAAVTQPRRRARRGRDRAVDRASARSIEVFSAGWRAARLEQEAHSRAWLCPPRRHKHASGPLRRLAATRSARSLPPACVRMAFACSEARGSVVTAVTATRPVAFSGALEASWQGLGAPGLGWF